MQFSFGLTCVDCNDEFKSAALLLQHFAKHATEHLETETISMKTDDLSSKKSKIPNLYPINRKRGVSVNETDRGSDSGIEDINPLKFCLVTMEENVVREEKEPIRDFENKMCMTSTLKKYQCTYCSRRFGWSTDLKRHILIHTGERPFHCLDCNSSFTRNFLLQKHQRKIHVSDTSKMKLPELKPIGRVISKKCRKQQKSKIKHKSCLDDDDQ
ncbi:hypothetical protein NQ318_017703, partial [Aromia moschata]